MRTNIGRWVSSTHSRRPPGSGVPSPEDAWNHPIRISLGNGIPEIAFDLHRLPCCCYSVTRSQHLLPQSTRTCHAANYE